MERKKPHWIKVKEEKNYKKDGEKKLQKIFLFHSPFCKVIMIFDE